MNTLLPQDPFSDLDIPDALQESLARHRENLAKLIMSLRSVGLDDLQVEASVSVMVDSYKQELLRTIKVIVRQ